jgi:hypothetical protein
MSGTKSDLIDAMVAIIRTPSIDDETARLAASVISIDANFNARVSNLKKQEIQKDNLFQLLDFADQMLEESRAVASAVADGISTEEIRDRLLALRTKIATYEV